MIAFCLPNVSLSSQLAYRPVKLITVAAIPNGAADIDIGAAEAYKAAVIFSHNPGGDAAPPWLANLNATVQQIAADVNQVRADHRQIVADLTTSR